MADINASFEYDANFGPAIAQIKTLAREISILNNSFNSLDKAALAAKKQLASSFQTNISSLGAFQTQVVDLSSDVDRFGEALQKNKLHMRDYFREARKAYTEGSKVRKLAVEQVRRAQTEIVSLGRDSTGRNKGMMITPLTVDTSNLKTSMAIAREQFNIFNKLVHDGSRELINWGKNTQWAGRQLTVGLTVPLTIFGSTLSRTFRDFDKELTRFQKVYGSDLVSTTTQASNEMRKQVELLAKDIAGKFGIAVSETAALAADLAATGLEGQKLTDSIQQTTKLSVLGEVNRQEAMKATLALQNAFNMSTQELADSINFLNAVENQTSVSIQDLTEAIPRTGPVINALGGDVKDLSVLLVAMKEGGISAAEGANAIKSGMASLINPTKQASATAAQFGIDLEGIVTRNKGKLMPTILEFQGAMQGLDEFARAQVIEQIFGKYQFARIAALFDNLNQQGSQTVEVIKLMSASSSDLAKVANNELRVLTESTSMRFQRAMESIKASLLPIGEALTSSVIPFLEKASILFNKIVEYGKDLPEPIKNFLKIAGGLTALAGPVVMITGVLANLLGYATKGVMGIVNLGRSISGLPTKQFELLNDEQIIALKATDNLTAAYARQDSTLAKLNGTMSMYLGALRTQAATNPGMMMPGAKTKKMARGGGIPGTGNSDSVPALLMPGEFVMNKEATKKFLPILGAMNKGNIKGFGTGSPSPDDLGTGKSLYTLPEFLGKNIKAAGGGAADKRARMIESTAITLSDAVYFFADEIYAEAKVTKKATEDYVNSWRKANDDFIKKQADLAESALQAGDSKTASKELAKVQNKMVADAKKAANAGDQQAKAFVTLGETAKKLAPEYKKQLIQMQKLAKEQGFTDFSKSSTLEEFAAKNPGNPVIQKMLVESQGRAYQAKSQEGQRAQVASGMFKTENQPVPGILLPTSVSTKAGKDVSHALLKTVQHSAEHAWVTSTQEAQREINRAKRSRSAAKTVETSQAMPYLGIEDDPQTSKSAKVSSKDRLKIAGRGILNRGASSANSVMGAAIALNSLSMMNEGFSSATKGLTNFTNGLMAVTSIMSLMQSGGVGGIGGKLKGLGKSSIVKGRAMSIASGGASKTGSLLMGAGRGLALLGGPAGMLALGAVAALTFAVVKYKQSITNARKEGEAMYASQTKAAEYYGITLKSVNDQMKTNAQISKNLGLAGGIGTAAGVDPALKQSILDQEENKKLVEQLKKSSDPSGIFLGQYGKMLQQGFDPAQAKEVLSVLAQASNKTGSLLGMSSTFAGITNSQQATAAVGKSFTQNISSLYGKGSVDSKDKARLQGAFSGVIESALMSPDLGQGLSVLQKSVSVAFSEGAKKGLSNKQVGETLGKSITSQMESLGLKKGDPLFDTINALGTTAQGTKDKMLAIQAVAAGIDMTSFIADGKLVKSELNQISQKLAQIDAAAQIDLSLDNELQKEIDMLNKVKNEEISRYDSLIAKNEEAKTIEEDRHKNFAKNIEKENKLLQKQIDGIQEGSDAYISAIEDENKAASFRQQQRQSALGGLSALSQGDVFGFIQAQQQMAAGAAEQGRQSELDAIRKQTEDAVKALKDQIDKNNELADGEDDRYEARMKQLENENAAIQANKAATIQAIDAAVQQAQVLKDLAPGQALSEDMKKYIGTLGTLANKLPPQAQKLVTDMAKTFNSDFNKIVSDAIATAGAEYGITDKSKLSQLIRSSIAGGAGPINMSVGATRTKATGGYIQGPGTQNSDSIPARLSNGEYVVRASAVKQYGTGLLNQINEKRFAKGGYVSATARGTQTGVAFGQGAVTESVVISALGKVIGDAIAAEEQYNGTGTAAGQIVSNIKLLGQVARILAGGFPVTSRDKYPSGKSHSAKYAGRAIDYGTPIGASVYAMADGLATLRDFGSSSYGKFVSIRHNDGTESIYGHLSNFAVKSGAVRAGERIGFTGNSGNSTGPHLHFEWSGLNSGENPPGMRIGGFTKSNGLANLHKGEAVLTAPLTADLKAGIEAMKYNVPQQSNVPVDNSVVSANVQYNVNVSGINMANPRSVANQVVKAIKVEDKRRNFGRRSK